MHVSPHTYAPMTSKQQISLSPLLKKMIDRLEQTGAGEVYIADDGHVFFHPRKGIDYIRGAIDPKKEGKAAAERIIIRQVRKRGKKCKYAGMPLFQIYVLPIVKKNTKTMTDAERRNMEMNTQALRMAHAVEKDPEQAAFYHELHEVHKRNPEGYKKRYPTFFGFLVATFRTELEKLDIQRNTEMTEHPEQPIIPDNDKDNRRIGIRLRVSTTKKPVRLERRHAFRAYIRLPMVA